MSKQEGLLNVKFIIDTNLLPLAGGRFSACVHIYRTSVSYYRLCKILAIQSPAQGWHARACSDPLFLINRRTIPFLEPSSNISSQLQQNII
jgi:hypothetical protein